MPRVLSSRTLYRELSSVFIAGDESAAQLIRLAILFEDLRIETTALKLQRDDPILTDCSVDTRTAYFLRRSLATLYEYAEALGNIGRTALFKGLPLSKTDRRNWNRATRFFQKRQQFINQTRNDVGAHFSKASAVRALRAIDRKETGAIEAVWLQNGESGLRLRFACQIAVSALMDHCWGSTPEIKVRRLFRILFVGYQHAIRATEVISVLYYWPRFESR